MCSVSWLGGAAGLHVFFNRDEQRRRAPGLPPVSGHRNGVSFLFPVDGKAGGTWIAANDRGLIGCLLNHYAASPSPPVSAELSRGAILPALMDAPSPRQAAARIPESAARDHRPFLLLLLHPGEPGVCLRWDGASLESMEIAGPSGFLTTSSFRTGEVVPARHAVAAALSPWTPESLRELHRSHVPERGPFSICMHRPDAHTVSFTHVHAGPDKILMEYHPGAPCQNRPAHPLSLPRHR